MQCSMAESFKANGTIGYCYNLTRTQNVLKFKIIMETVCDLCLQRMSYKSTEKLF